MSKIPATKNLGIHQIYPLYSRHLLCSGLIVNEKTLFHNMLVCDDYKHETFSTIPQNAKPNPNLNPSIEGQFSYTWYTLRATYHYP